MKNIDHLVTMQYSAGKTFTSLHLSIDGKLFQNVPKNLTKSSRHRPRLPRSQSNQACMGLAWPILIHGGPQEQPTGLLGFTANALVPVTTGQTQRSCAQDSMGQRKVWSKIGPQQVILDPAHPPDAWLDWDLGSFETVSTPQAFCRITQAIPWQFLWCGRVHFPACLGGGGVVFTVMVDRCTNCVQTDRHLNYFELALYFYPCGPAVMCVSATANLFVCLWNGGIF